jgi:hypothetical protein
LDDCFRGYPRCQRPDDAVLRRGASGRPHRGGGRQLAQAAVPASACVTRSILHKIELYYLSADHDHTEGDAEMVVNADVHEIPAGAAARRPSASLTLRRHQAGQRTYTSKLSISSLCLHSRYAAAPPADRRHSRGGGPFGVIGLLEHRYGRKIEWLEPITEMR